MSSNNQDSNNNQNNNQNSNNNSGKLNYNQLPRIINNASNKNTFAGGSQVAVGIVMIIFATSFWMFQRFVLDIFFRGNNSPLTILFWAMLIVGSWFISAGYDRIMVNNSFKKLRNYLGNNDITIDHLSDLLGSTNESLLKDISLMSQRGYWSNLKINDKTLELRQNVGVPAGQPYLINAGEGMRFSPIIKHIEMPHLPVAICLIALAVLLPLPLTDLLWIILALALSFPLKKVLSVMLPKKQFINYSRVPEFAPEEIQLELSGNEQADELIALSEKHLNQLQHLSLNINDDRLKSTIGELSTGLNQMTKILKEFPEKHRQVRQTLDYSIPTAIKLYYKYIELNSQPVKGENIEKSMDKIHEMSDLVSSTFKRELNSLYQDQNLDIEVDVEVMRNMLQQESIEIPPLMRNLDKDKK